MIKSEVYIEPVPSNKKHLEVNIFSRMKMQWVYNDQVRVDDVLFLLHDLRVLPGNSIIRMSPETMLYEEFLKAGFEVKVFAGGNSVKRRNAFQKFYENFKKSLTGSKSEEI